MAVSSSARLFAAVIALIAAGSMGLQLSINTIELGSLAAGAAQMLRYFTILTNIAVMLIMARIALGWRPARMLVLAMVVAIVMVGLIYHVALAHLLDPQGWEIVADQGVHSAVPVLCSLWWLLFARARKSDWRRLHFVLVWPLIYTTYVLARGQLTGIYPYPFMDLNEISVAMLLRNLLVLVALFWLVGAALHGAVQMLRRR